MPLLIFFFLLFCTEPVYSEEVSSSIILNEFVIEPQQQVEIMNNSDQSVDISSWHIDDDGGSTYFTVPDGTIVEANHCVVLSGNFNLNKTSQDTIRLFNKTAEPISPDAQLIDSYTYNRSQGVSISFQRIPDGETWATGSATIGLWNVSREKCTGEPTATPSPTTNTMTPTPRTSLTPPPDNTTNVYISEFYPAPLSGEKEWVELFNNNPFEVTLTDWYIDDAENAGGSPKSFTATISPQGYSVIELQVAILNNSGDEVRVLNPQKKVIDELMYEDAESGFSIGWSEILGSRYCPQDPTPGEINTSCLLLDKLPERIDTTTNKTVLGTSHDISSSPIQSKTFSPTHFLITASVPEFQLIATQLNQSPPTSVDFNTSQQISSHPNSSEPISVATQSHFNAFPFSSVALLSIFSIGAKMKLQL